MKRSDQLFRFPSPDLRLLLGILLLVVVSGCGLKGNPYPVNAVKARELLKTAMEAWKSGKTPEEMPNGTPAIVVQDFDWMQGKKLKDYEINSQDAETGANLTSQVTLHLEDKEGNTEEKAVYYVVGTSPNFTVFRDAR